MVPVAPEHVTSKAYFRLFGITETGRVRYDSACRGRGGMKIDSAILSADTIVGIREFKIGEGSTGGRHSTTLSCFFSKL
jgi:hypothetical protein